MRSSPTSRRSATTSTTTSRPPRPTSTRGCASAPPTSCRCYVGRGPRRRRRSAKRQAAVPSRSSRSDPSPLFVCIQYELAAGCCKPERRRMLSGCQCERGNGRLRGRNVDKAARGRARTIRVAASNHKHYITSSIPLASVYSRIFIVRYPRVLVPPVFRH